VMMVIVIVVLIAVLMIMMTVFVIMIMLMMSMMMVVMLVRMFVRLARIRFENERFHGDRHRLRGHADASEIDVVEVPQRHPVDHQDLAAYVQFFAQDRA